MRKIQEVVGCLPSPTEFCSKLQGLKELREQQKHTMPKMKQRLKELQLGEKQYKCFAELQYMLGEEKYDTLFVEDKYTAGYVHRIMRNIEKLLTGQNTEVTTSKIDNRAFNKLVREYEGEDLHTYLHLNSNKYVIIETTELEGVGLYLFTHKEELIF